MAKAAVAQHGIAISMACTAFGISETFYRYQTKRQAENEETANWLIRLSDNNCNYHHERPNMAMGGFIPKQRLAMAA